MQIWIAVTETERGSSSAASEVYKRQDLRLADEHHAVGKDKKLGHAVSDSSVGYYILAKVFMLAVTALAIALGISPSGIPVMSSPQPAVEIKSLALPL